MLTIDGTYDVDGAGTIADQVNALGVATLGPSSVLNLYGTFNPDTTFTLLTFDSMVGVFGTVNGLPASHNLVYNSFNMQLVPVPVPEPSVAIIGLLASSFCIRRRRTIAG
jgi:hypothetical protein